MNKFLKPSIVTDSNETNIIYTNKIVNIDILNNKELNITNMKSINKNKLLSPDKTENNSSTFENENIIVSTVSNVNKTDSKLQFSNDPAHWEINVDLISYFSENIPVQNIDANLNISARQFGTKTRYFRKEYFSRALGNGEFVKRDWLIFSPSTGYIYCYVCKIFRPLKERDDNTTI